MKLSFPSIEIEKSGDFQTKSFGFGDTRTIINILRSKIYSNPIHIICQEIMSNARDAHREVGRDSTPIRVKIPSLLDLTLSISDNGPGISPSRMENIFLLYGNSTKRADDKQTGGFGLGAKTPFSYTDTFNITTVVEENGERTKYNYVAYIDDSQMGAMSLLSSVKTNEHTGTTISMPIKKTDVNAFTMAVASVGEFFTPRPTISGGHIAWKNPKKMTETADFMLFESSSTMPIQGSNICLIDSIPYPLNRNAILSWINEHRAGLYSPASSLFSNRIALKFSVGEIPLAASREAIDYNDKTYGILADKIERIIKELNKEADAKLAKATTLKEATEIFRTFEFSYIISGLEWRGIKLNTSYRIEHLDQSGDFLIYHYSKNRKGVMKTSTSTYAAYYPCDTTTPWYFDNTYKDSTFKLAKDGTKIPVGPNKNKVRTIWQEMQAKNINNFYLLRFNSLKHHQDILKDKTNIFNFIQWEGNLANVKETKIKYNKSTTPGTAASMGQLRTLQKISWTTRWTEDKNIDLQKGGVYVALATGLKEAIVKIGAQEKRLDKHTIQRIESKLNIKVVGCGARSVVKFTKLNGWKSLSDVLAEAADAVGKKIANIGKIYRVKDRYSQPYYFDWLKKNSSKLSSNSKIRELFTNISNGDAHQAIMDDMNFHSSIGTLTVTNNLSYEEIDIASFCNKHYPLLHRILCSTIAFSKEEEKEILTYINMKDGVTCSF